MIELKGLIPNRKYLESREKHFYTALFSDIPVSRYLSLISLSSPTPCQCYFEGTQHTSLNYFHYFAVLVVCVICNIF